MTMQLKQMTAAVALTLALPASAYALQGVTFDPDGTGGASQYIVQIFDWGPAQVLYSNCFGSIGIASPLCAIHAQGSIAALNAPGGAILTIPAGVTYTFAMSVGASQSSVGSAYDGNTPTIGNTIAFSDKADLTSLFTIYVDSTPGAGDPNALAGTGFTGTPAQAILTGRVTIVDYTISNSGGAAATANLDQFGPNDYAGLLTQSTSGSPTFTIDVLTINTDYFKDPLTSFALQLEDANQADNSVTPFKQANPASKVDATPFVIGDVGADSSSDIYCGKGGITTCSGQFQGDASTTFLTEAVPEPGMLALLGIGLAGLGAFTRRRGRQDVTAA